jgi:L-alanine-DL-glutamate epimerase-like enolase superfamily enzyme
VIGNDATKINKITLNLKLKGYSNQAILGIEMAIWVLLRKRVGKPLYQILKGKVTIKHRFVG